MKKQVEPQTKLISMMVARLDRMEKWSQKLWGNGTGPPGYLENARQEDKDKFERLFEEVDRIKADALREEGKESVLKELELQRIEDEKLNDVKKTNRLARFHYWWVILGSFAGTWVLSLIRPAIHAFIDMTVKAMK